MEATVRLAGGRLKFPKFRRYKVAYVLLAILFIIYGIGLFLIPVDFPAQIGTLGKVKLLPLAFSLGFIALNAVLVYIALHACNRAIARREGQDTYYLSRIRDVFIAAFGFGICVRTMFCIMWIIQASA
ncbi:MAG: hypothetical protein PHV85_04670 [Desulfovibrionaceae bacterium]|nr:hypothetical protein [Desulfovibrionaceae bacterium]